MHPQAEQEYKSPISLGNWEIWTVGVDNLVVLACVLKATTKKGQLFRKRKVHHTEKILATPMSLSACYCRQRHTNSAASDEAL